MLGQLLIRAGVVDEEQIAAAMRQYLAGCDEAIEGAAGVALAGMLARADAIKGQKVAVIICGGNVSQQVLDSISLN